MFASDGVAQGVDRIAGAGKMLGASRIAGTGMFVPPRVVNNLHFASYLETSDEWIQERTGIVERRWAGDGVTSSDLAEPACRDAIKNAGLVPADIDGIIFATVTPDFVFPSTACVLQRRLGIPGCLAFDVNAVCSGFLYALVSADALISRGVAKNVLVVGSEVFSKLVNPKDRGTCILFGDGAGAVVLTATSAAERDSGGSGILGSILGADGTYGDILCVPAGGMALPSTPELIEEGKHLVTMAGKEVFKLAVRYLADISEKVIRDAGYTPEDVKVFVCHQANKRILQAVAKYLKVSEEHFPMNVDRYGNTSAASVPILLAELSAQGVLKKGDLVVLNAFGGGVTWGAALIRW